MNVFENNIHIIFGFLSIITLIIYKIKITQKDSYNHKKFIYLVLILVFSFISEIFIFFVIYKNYKLINIEEFINKFVINFKNNIKIDNKIKNICLFEKNNSIYIPEMFYLNLVNNAQNDKKKFYYLNKKKSYMLELKENNDLTTSLVNSNTLSYDLIKMNENKLAQNVFLEQNIVLAHTERDNIIYMWSNIIINNEDYNKVLEKLSDNIYNKNFFILQTYMANIPENNLDIKDFELFLEDIRDEMNSKMRYVKKKIEEKEYILINYCIDKKKFIDKFKNKYGENVFNKYILKNNKIYTSAFIKNYINIDNKRFLISNNDENNKFILLKTDLHNEDYNDYNLYKYDNNSDLPINNNYHITNIYNSKKNNNQKLAFILKKNTYVNYINYLKNSDYDTFDILNIYLTNTPYDQLNETIKTFIDENEKEDNNKFKGLSNKSWDFNILKVITFY